MSSEPAVKPMNLAVGAILLVAAAAGAWAMLRLDPWQERRTIDDLPPVSQELVGWQQTAEFPTGLGEVSALAAGPDGAIYVGGDRMVVAFTPQGALAGEKIELSAQPTSLAIGGANHAHPGRIYVGLGDHVEVFAPDGKPVARWKTPGENALLSSIACSEEDVFVADSGTKTVWRYDLDGGVKNRIGDRDLKRHVPGFLITDPKHFDLALGGDGLLHVVNPRALRIEAYTFSGDLEGKWGKSSSADDIGGKSSSADEISGKSSSANEIEGFFGCCNPAHLAVLSDGRYVTGEKGIGRIKVYSSEGKFQCIVAGAPQMSDTIADLSVAPSDRVLVLDARAKSVRVFQPKAQAGESHHES